MRTLEPTVRLWVDEGILGGQCFRCGIYLEQADDAESLAARQAFFAVHPESGSVPHIDRVPVGWIRPLSGPGALSQ